MVDIVDGNEGKKFISKYSFWRVFAMGNREISRSVILRPKILLDKTNSVKESPENELEIANIDTRPKFRDLSVPAEDVRDNLLGRRAVIRFPYILNSSKLLKYWSHAG